MSNLVPRPGLTDRQRLVIRLSVGAALVVCLYFFTSAVRTYGALAFYERGKESVDAHRYAEAIRQFRRALWFRLDFTPARSRPGQALLDSGRTVEAVIELDESIRQASLASDFVTLGDALARPGNLSGVREPGRHALMTDEWGWVDIAKERLKASEPNRQGGMQRVSAP